MRATQWFSPTLKETPNDAEIVSHQLMLRAGMIRRLGSGLYSWLPAGLKVLRKVEQIVREELNRAQAIELLMPAVQPMELWEETGRWESFGGQLLKMRDSNNREYCFGPTHEEVITDIMRNELRSYKQLPLNLYQIQTKFRDEIRPRFGVMRAREFLMKDAYSFHIDQQSLQETYDKMYQAYSRIFDRLGLSYRAVEADTGAIGGSASHEFQVLADAGEDLIFYSDQSSYAANIEQATYLKPDIIEAVDGKPLEIVETPGQKTIQDIVEFLKLPIEQTIKTLIVEGEETELVALVLRGDDELNEIKAEKHPLVKAPLRFADEAVIKEKIKASPGSIGPVKLEIPVIVDWKARAIAEFACGANEDDKHFIHAQWERDGRCDEIFDLRNVKNGDPSPDGQGTLQSCRGIEVGHIFQLGKKYAEAMNATVLNEEGKAQTLIMGCYGLGLSRVVAAAIEQTHDERGIIWPQAIAPFELVIIPLNGHRSEDVAKHSEALYQRFMEMGIDVLLDDRKERAGVLFADNDLIGIPHRLVISDKLLEQGQIEYKARSEADNQLLPIEDIEAFIKDQLAK